MTSRGQQLAAPTFDLLSLVSLAVIAVAVVANLQSQEIWAAASVAIVALWAVDVRASFQTRGRDFAPLAVTVTAAGAALTAHTLGGVGYGMTVGLAVVVGLGWAVAFDPYRKVEIFAPTLLVGLLGGLGVASLLLARTAGSPDPASVDVFMVSVIAGLSAGTIVSRMPATPFLDPFSATAVVAVLGSILAAVIWDLDVVGYLLVGLGVAVALIAGTGLSTMLRTGQVRLTERAPGLVPSLDGAVLAAAVYFPLIRLIL